MLWLILVMLMFSWALWQTPRAAYVPYAPPTSAATGDYPVLYYIDRQTVKR